MPEITSKDRIRNKSPNEFKCRGSESACQIRSPLEMQERSRALILVASFLTLSSAPSCEGSSPERLRQATIP